MPVEIAALAASVTAVLGTLFMGHKWLVKAYLRELVPNGGSSMADRVRRVEERVDAIYDHLLTGGRS